MRFGAPASYSEGLAGTAVPFCEFPALDDSQVVAAERMPTLAMRLTGIGGLNACTPKHVLVEGYRFEMFRVNTGGVSAQMVKNQALWDLPDKVFIGPSMSTHMAVPNGRSSPEHAIPVLVSCGNPKPAVSRHSGTDFGPEPDFDINPLFPNKLHKENTIT